MFTEKGISIGSFRSRYSLPLSSFISISRSEAEKKFLGNISSCDGSSSMVKDGWGLTLIPSMTENLRTTFPSSPRRNLLGLMETLTFNRSSTSDNAKPSSKNETKNPRMYLFISSLFEIQTISSLFISQL